MSWWKRLRNWWACAKAPLPPEETMPDAQDAQLEDDPDVQQAKQALDAQIAELLHVHPEAAPRVEQAKRKAEREASRWLATQRRIWAEEHADQGPAR